MEYKRRANTILGRLLEDLNAAMEDDIKALGVSRREAAELIGISNSTLYDVFVHSNRPQKKTLKKICSAAIWSRHTREIIHKIERFFPDLSTGKINADTNLRGDVFRISAPETLSDTTDIKTTKKS